MGVLTRSLWLPIGRANFFSVMTDPDLLGERAGVGPKQCQSTRRDSRPGYIPHLRESVFRRLAEVLPASFGYDRVGVCEFTDQQDGQPWPVSLTMTLRPHTAEVGLVDAKEAHGHLRLANVTMVTLRIDENGFYTFTAHYRDGGPTYKKVETALVRHMVTVFGGAFEVDRLGQGTDRRANEGAAAIRRYNGLAEDASADQTAKSPPLGVLSFYQLNIMMESLCNQSLLPAVFFEQYETAGAWLHDNRRKSSMVTHLNDFVTEIIVAADAGSPAGQTMTLRRFLVVSRGSLQWMRRSVESVRRSLLDHMMAVAHRQARLIQLNLSGIDYERTPEMTGAATESQMRGYVMLVATKLPLLCTVADCAKAAVATVEHQAKQVEQQAAQAERDGSMAADVPTQVADLAMSLRSWSALLDGLLVNVDSLGTAVEHDWQERLLYEQEQARSEQEAMAEIERSRRGRPETRRVGDAAYNAIMLILTAVAVFIAVQTSQTPNNDTKRWWEQLIALWPLGVAAVVLLLVWPAFASVRRLRRQRKPDSDTYGFEFAFRLDEPSSQEKVNTYLERKRPERVRSTAFRKIALRRLGGWRVERISSDTTLLKVHSVAAVRVATLRFARFEIVTEIIIRSAGANSQYFLRQCRMFGDSPIPLTQKKIVDLLGDLLCGICTPLAVDFNRPEIDALLRPIHPGQSTSDQSTSSQSTSGESTSGESTSGESTSGESTSGQST